MPLAPDKGRKDSSDSKCERDSVEDDEAQEADVAEA